MPKEQLAAIFKEIDFLKSGSLSYTQFVASCLSEKDLEGDRLYVVFRTWDLDKDGILSKADCEKFVNSEYPEMLKSDSGQELLTEFDKEELQEVNKHQKSWLKTQPIDFAITHTFHRLQPKGTSD